MGMLCLREEGREGVGDGSLLPVTLDDTRLFLSGLQRQDGTKTNRHFHCAVRGDPQTCNKTSVSTWMQCCWQEIRSSSSSSSWHAASVCP